MGYLRQSTFREAQDPAFGLFLAAIALSMIKASDQPGVSVSLAGTSVTLVPEDVVLAILAVVLAVRVIRTRAYPTPAVSLTVAATALASLILVTGFANGAVAVVSAGKLVMLAFLLVGAVLLIDSIDRLWVVVGLLVVVGAAGVAWGLVGFAQHPGNRQASFLGEHDLAALSTAVLVVGLAALHSRHRLAPLPLVAGIVGSLGIILGAALASLLGLYLAAAAMILIAALRGSLRVRSVVITVLVAALLTGATATLRSGQFGFLQQWFDPVENAQPGQYAGSWSQRLIYAYVGGRVFLEHPVLGTGWWGELPPPVFAHLLPDARARFPDQPPRYFPPADRPFIPQQTFDQVGYELGLVGLAVLLALIASAARDGLRSGRNWPPAERDELAAYLGLPWLGSLLGAVAGSALFGGTPMAALFWLTFGLVGALVVLQGRPSRAEPAPA